MIFREAETLSTDDTCQWGQAVPKAREAGQPPCEGEPSVRVRGFKLCTAHLRRALVEPTLREHTRSLLRPMLSTIVVLRDIESGKTAGGLWRPVGYMGAFGQAIDVDGNTRSNRYDLATGIVLAAGPGFQSSKWRSGRVPMAARVGARIVFKAKHENSMDYWRGLCLLSDNEGMWPSVLGEVEEVARVG